MQLVPDGQGDVDVFFHHNDHLGTPRLVTDASGNIVWRGWHEPFGKMHEACGPGCDGPCNFHQPLRFPGQWDYGDGVSYSWHRYVLPDYGLFLSPDPLPLSGSQSLFLVPGNGADGLRLWSYSLNSPLLASDPDGRNPLLLILLAAFIADACTPREAGGEAIDQVAGAIDEAHAQQLFCRHYCDCVAASNSMERRQACCERFSLACPVGQACYTKKIDCGHGAPFGGPDCASCNQ